MEARTRHIGLDLGGTNIKWAVVAGSDDDWQTLDQGSVPTDTSGGERTVVPQLAALALEVRDGAGGPVDSLGVAVPGLYIPETAKEKPQRGEIIAIGDDEENIKVKVGQKVLFPKYTGSEFKNDGVEHMIMNADDLLAILIEA